MTNKFVNDAISETIKDIENELGMELSINNSKNEDKEESISKDTEKLMKEEVEKQNISVKMYLVTIRKLHQIHFNKMFLVML